MKFWETLFEGGLWKSCGTLHVWWWYGNCLYQKVGPSWEVRLAGIRLHTGCKGVTGYCHHCWIFGAIFMGCVDVCLEKKKRIFWGEAGAGICLVGATRWKCGDNGAGFWWRVRELPLEQNGLPSMVNIMQIVSAKFHSTRGASHLPAIIGIYLTIVNCVFNCVY